MKPAFYIRLISIVSIAVLGISAREFQGFYPNLLTRYLPDVLWAAMVYLVCSVLLKNRSSTLKLCVALLATYLVELSQLYQAPWVNDIRVTQLGGLFLGHTFALSDIICYSIGCPIGLWVEKKVLSKWFPAIAV